jgi:hypothetical protein
MRFKVTIIAHQVTAAVVKLMTMTVYVMAVVDLMTVTVYLMSAVVGIDESD